MAWRSIARISPTLLTFIVHLPFSCATVAWPPPCTGTDLSRFGFAGFHSRDYMQNGKLCNPNGITVGGCQSESPHVTRQKRLAGIPIGMAFC
jgi:hypothetical protein